MNHLFFDTETTGFIRKLPDNDPQQPHLVQLAALLVSDDGTDLGNMNVLVRPDGWTIPDVVANIHGVTTARALADGLTIATVMDLFHGLYERADTLIAHNLDFDCSVMRVVYARHNITPPVRSLAKFCTMKTTTPILQLPKKRGSGFKWPKLQELHKFLFGGEEFADAHDALVDIRATAKCYFELKRQNLIP